MSPRRFGGMTNQPTNDPQYARGRKAEHCLHSRGALVVSNRGPVNAAYDAVLELSLAVLAANGWKTRSELGHHQDALEAADEAVDLSQGAFDRADALRDMRNWIQYGGQAVTDVDVTQAMKVMEEAAPALVGQAQPVAAAKTAARPTAKTLQGSMASKSDRPKASK